MLFLSFCHLSLSIKLHLLVLQSTFTIPTPFSVCFPALPHATTKSACLPSSGVMIGFLVVSHIKSAVASQHLGNFALPTNACCNFSLNSTLLSSFFNFHFLWRDDMQSTFFHVSYHIQSWCPASQQLSTIASIRVKLLPKFYTSSFFKFHCLILGSAFILVHSNASDILQIHIRQYCMGTFSPGTALQSLRMRL